MKKLFFLYPLLLSLLFVRGQTIENNLRDSSTGLHKQGKWWMKPAMALGYAGADWLCYRYLDTQVQDESQEGKTPFKTSVFTGIGQLGLGKVQTVSWGATALVSVLTKNRKLQQASIIWLGSLAINSTLTDQLKKTFQRHRPYSGSPYNTFDWRKGPGINTSFPSAHTSNAFTTATVFATLYKDHKWVPYLAYGLASLVGASRIYNNAHWASDVVTGAAIGFLSAKAATALYKCAGKKWVFLPQADIHGGAVTMVYQFR
jgi:membrane-associated phospholipid phosphatase